MDDPRRDHQGRQERRQGTDAQCDAMLLEGILAHEHRMLACAPELLIDPDKTYVAINDWAFKLDQTLRDDTC